MATLPAYFQQNPDVAAAYRQETYGLTPQQFADTHYALYGQAEQRAAPTAAAAPVTATTPAVAPAVTPVTVPATTPVTVPATTPAVVPVRTASTTPVVAPTTPAVNRASTGAALPYFQLNPDVAAAYLTNNYGLTPEQFAAAHYSQYGQNEQRTAPTQITTPFASATQGFDQNFRNYTSIPIGAQYNPNVVGGTGSPYSQIMGQMRPVGNPYANVAAGQAMGGYDPGLYDRIAQANAVAKLATETAAAAADPGQISDGLAQGGMVHGGLMFGANPPGPDDGAVNLDMGEYVIKKSSVNKYGKGLLDMINEGKVPAKKMKSLLG